MFAFKDRRARQSAWHLMSVLALVPSAVPAQVVAQDHGHVDDHTHGVHFTHPLFTESISPDTKVRLDYSRLKLVDAESEFELEGEYAFARSFSIEAGVGFDAGAGKLGETHILLKFANYAFEDAGWLLGYGIEFGLPTGSGGPHGSPEPGMPSGGGDPEATSDVIYEISPFLNGGFTAGPLELVGWTLFEIPTNQTHQDDVGTELRYNASVLYHAGARIDALVEAFGHRGLSGPETDLSTVSLAPGLGVRPLAWRPLVVGTGIAFPLTNDRDFDTRILVSAFLHF